MQAGRLSIVSEPTVDADVRPSGLLALRHGELVPVSREMPQPVHRCRRPMRDDALVGGTFPCRDAGRRNAGQLTATQRAPAVVLPVRRALGGPPPGPALPGSTVDASQTESQREQEPRGVRHRQAKVIPGLRHVGRW